MDTIDEEGYNDDAVLPTLSDKAAAVVQQVEQAALTTRTSKDRLDLVTKLTDYVSEAIAEGSLTDSDLQRIFMVTKRIGDQIPDLVPALETTSTGVNVSEQQPAEASRHTTSELLDWADDPATKDACLTVDTPSINSNAGQSNTNLLEGLQKVAERSLYSPSISEQRAAKALLNAAKHSRGRSQQAGVHSRYMDGVDVNIISVSPAGAHMTEGRSTEAGMQSNTRHMTSGKQRQASQRMPSAAPVHQRLYQLSETWRAHKAQLKDMQEEKDSRAASPTPPARLTSHARQRAAERLYAHAVQKRERQEAARQAQNQEASRSRSPSPRSRASRRHAPDFFQRQQDLLARRQMLAEQRRPADEESLQHCTGRPAISAFAHSLRRSTNDLMAWQASKDEKMQRMRQQQAEQKDAELTLIPRIDRNSRQMALNLASRAAEQNPEMLTVIQSQPQGWVLADRPGTARRPAMPDVSIVRPKSASAAPAWVHASSTSMRLVQTGRAPAGTSHMGSATGASSPRASSQAGSHAAFQQAPWMGHGGVRNLEVGHTEATHKAYKPDRAADVRHTPLMHMPQHVSTGGKASHLMGSNATVTRTVQSRLSSHRLADAHMDSDDDAHTHGTPPDQTGQHSLASTVDAVDPIEAFAPAFMLERGGASAVSSAKQPSNGYNADTIPQPLTANVSAKAPVEAPMQSSAATVQASKVTGPTEGEWTGFAVDDSTADGADYNTGNRADSPDTASLYIDESSKQQANPAITLSAPAIDRNMQAARQANVEEPAAVAHDVPLSPEVASANHAEPYSGSETASAATLPSRRVSGASLTGTSPAATLGRKASRDRQPMISRKQSGIAGARKALQAMALKAAAEAAYKTDASTGSPSSLQQSQSAMHRTISRNSRHTDGLWSPQSTSASQDEPPGNIVSMHSVLKQKPRTLVPNTKMSTSIHDAAMQQASKIDPRYIAAASHGYAKRESLRRQSSGDVSVQSLKASHGKTVKQGFF